MTTGKQLQAIMPLADVRKWYGALMAGMFEFGIQSPLSQAAFFANIAAESGQLRCVEENLKYSAQALARTWPKRYADEHGMPNALALRLDRDPQAIANNVYANRLGNGDEASGDGWKYRGAGLIQTTGKNNQLAVAKEFNIDPDHVGDWLRTVPGAARSAGYFWKTAGCEKFAEAKDFDGVCDLINQGRKTARQGDAIGYAERLKFYKTALAVLGA